MFNQGISRMGDLLEIGSSKGIVKKSGAFYSYGETRLGQGRENAKEFLLQHPEIAASVENRIRADSDLATPGPEPEIDEDDESLPFGSAPSLNGSEPTTQE
jgi:recombination protein RecA